MISVTTARAAAPNLGGRANTRGRAVVATSQSPTFTVARQPGAACLLGDFLCNAAANGLQAGSSPGAAACLGEDPTLCLDLPDASDALRAARGRAEKTTRTLSCGRVARATFTAPPRTTTRASGNYGNGWRNFYAVSNAERTSHGCPVGYRDNTGCCAGVRYTVLSTPFARALLTKALAGTRWSAMTAPTYCRSRRAFRGPLPALAGLSFYGVAERIERIANRSVRPTVVARKDAA